MLANEPEHAAFGNPVGIGPQRSGTRSREILNASFLFVTCHYLHRKCDNFQL